MKHLAFALALILSSCGTVKYGLKINPSDISLNEKQSKKVAVIRSFYFTDHLRGKGVHTNISHDEKLEEAIRSSFDKSNYFNDITFQRFDSDGLSFKRKSITDRDTDIQKVLSKFKPSDKVDFYINAYIKNSVNGLHGGHGVMYWGMLHMISLGFIPFMDTEESTLVLEFYNRKGQLVSKKSVTNEIKKYSWTPAFLWGGKFGGWKYQENLDILVEGSVRKILVDSGL